MNEIVVFNNKDKKYEYIKYELMKSGLIYFEKNIINPDFIDKEDVQMIINQIYEMEKL